MTLALTLHETEALSLAARGCSMREIAGELRKSPETVKAQLGLARLKLGARNTTHAVALAMHDGLIAA